MKAKKPNTTPLWRLLLLLYGLLMVWLLFGRSSGWVEGLSYRQQLERSTNLHPFFTIRNYVYVVLYSSNGYLIRHCFVNLLGNVLLFIPAGFLLPRIFRKLQKFIPFFLTCFGMILCVELLQLFTLLGSFDVDDILLNLLGMSLGFLIYRLTRK